MTESSKQPTTSEMAPTPATDSDEDRARRERRRNLRLRELVDEMMASIRVAAGRDLWSPEERARYEQELSEIMSRVRTEAVSDRQKNEST
jgi:hypothetical protein